MKVKDILDIDEGRLSRAKDIQVTLLKTYPLYSEPSNKIIKWLRRLFQRPYIITYAYLFQTVNVKSSSTYKVIIEIGPQNDYRRVLNSEAKIYCQCADFKFRSAWVLNHTDNLFLNKNIETELSVALDQKPTNMNNTTTSCKHIVAAFGYIKRNFKDLNLILK